MQHSLNGCPSMQAEAHPKSCGYRVEDLARDPCSLSRRYKFCEEHSTLVRPEITSSPIRHNRVLPIYCKEPG